MCYQLTGRVISDTGLLLEVIVLYFFDLSLSLTLFPSLATLHSTTSEVSLVSSVPFLTKPKQKKRQKQEHHLECVLPLVWVLAFPMPLHRSDDDPER